MPESEDRGIAVMRGVAANDNPGSGAGTGGGAAARVDTAVVTLARLIGRRIAREEYERPDATNDNEPAKDAGGRWETGRHDPALRALRPLLVRPAAGRLRSRTSSGSAASARRARAGRSWAPKGTPPSPATAGSCVPASRCKWRTRGEGCSRSRSRRRSTG